MRQGVLIDRYNKLSESFQLYFNKTLEDQGIEDIHQLRVTIKKLRAIWSLMESASGGKWTKKEHFAHTSKLFAEAGKVREAQVNLSMIAKYKVQYLIPYAEYLGGIQKSATERLLREMKAFDSKKLDHLNKELHGFMKKYTSENAFRYSICFLLKEIVKVHRLSDELPDDRKLHKIRIHLKAVAEILNIITKLKARSGLKMYLRKIKSINEHIGNWHDHIILVKSIKQFVKKDRTKKSNRRLNSFIVRIGNQQASKQEKIINLIRNNITEQRIRKIENLG